MIYNYVKGIYEPLTDNLLTVIIKTLLETAKPLYGWSVRRNKEIMASFRVDISLVNVNDKSYQQLIAIKNGVINLATSEFIKPSLKYFLTRYIDISYDNTAECPKFMKFLRETACNDKDLEMVIQEMCGYILINNCNAEKIFFLTGVGSNGKSVLMNVLSCVIGEENISTIQLSDFDYRFGFTSLQDKLLNIATETEEEYIPSTDKLKLFASGEKITINKKHADSIEMESKAKLIFLTNNLPILKDLSAGMRRKYMIIPFNNRVTADKKDVNLSKTLSTEREGIFRFFVEGAKRLISNNYQFTKCEVIDAFDDDYYKSMNPVENFVADKIVKKGGSRTPRAKIMDAYKNWLKENSVSGNGTDSPQRFWKLFEEAIQNIYKESPVYKKNNGYLQLIDFYIGNNKSAFDKDVDICYKPKKIRAKSSEDSQISPRIKEIFDSLSDDNADTYDIADADIEDDDIDENYHNDESVGVHMI